MYFGKLFYVKVNVKVDWVGKLLHGNQTVYARRRNISSFVTAKKVKKLGRSKGYAVQGGLTSGLVGGGRIRGTGCEQRFEDTLLEVCTFVRRG